MFLLKILFAIAATALAVGMAIVFAWLLAYSILTVVLLGTGLVGGLFAVRQLWRLSRQ